MIFSLNIETKYALERPREGQSVVEIFVDGKKFAEYVYGYTEDEPVSYLVVHRDKKNELDHLEKAVIKLLEYYYHPSPEEDPLESGGGEDGRACITKEKAKMERKQDEY